MDRSTFFLLTTDNHISFHPETPDEKLVVSNSETNDCTLLLTNLILQLQFPDRHLAQLEFLNLAGCGHGVGIYKLHILGVLIVGNLTPTEIPDLIRSHLHTFFQDNGSHDLLAILAVGNAVHLDVGDFRVSVEKLFDFPGVDIFPPRIIMFFMRPVILQ